MRLVIISDSHGLHHQVTVPDGDVLVHCGDVTNDIGQASLRSFLEWFNRQPHVNKLFIAGNHDGAFEKWNDKARLMVDTIAPTCRYIQESEITIDGIKFYGMPHTPEFCNWHFNVPRDRMHEHTDKIPDDTDVLITHGPPINYLDISGFDNSHVGCRATYEAMLRVQPKVHCFGHVHHGWGRAEVVHDTGAKTHLLNASVVNERYRVVNHPWIIEV